MPSKKKEKPKSFPVLLSTSAERKKALEDKEAAREKEAAATADVMKMAHSASKSDSGTPHRRRSVGAQKLSERKSPPTRGDDKVKAAASLQPPANASIQPQAKASYVAAVQQEDADNNKAADIDILNIMQSYVGTSRRRCFAAICVAVITNYSFGPFSSRRES